MATWQIADKQSSSYHDSRAALIRQWRLWPTRTTSSQSITARRNQWPQVGGHLRASARDRLFVLLSHRTTIVTSNPSTHLRVATTTLLHTVKTYCHHCLERSIGLNAQQATVVLFIVTDDRRRSAPTASPSSPVPDLSTAGMNNLPPPPPGVAPMIDYRALLSAMALARHTPLFNAFYAMQPLQQNLQLGQQHQSHLQPPLPLINAATGSSKATKRRASTTTIATAQQVEQQQIAGESDGTLISVDTDVTGEEKRMKTEDSGQTEVIYLASDLWHRCCSATTRHRHSSARCARMCPVANTTAYSRATAARASSSGVCDAS